MSVLRRVVISRAEEIEPTDRERSYAINPLPVRDMSSGVWARVHATLQRRIAVMEANIDKATDAWGTEQGLSRTEWETRMRNYAFALEELHKLAEDLTASQNEVP
jgi:hypothetical protein